MKTFKSLLVVFIISVSLLVISAGIYNIATAHEKFQSITCK